MLIERYTEQFGPDEEDDEEEEEEDAPDDDGSQSGMSASFASAMQVCVQHFLFYRRRLWLFIENATRYALSLRQGP